MHLRKINNVCGWLAFAIAVAVYMSTLEPSISFRDYGEFIACVFRLETGHQPGAPFILILGRLFCLFAGNNTAMVAKMVNSLSSGGIHFCTFYGPLKTTRFRSGR